MSRQDGVSVRSVVWSDLCPWLVLLRVFRLAISLRSLVFGAAAILLTLLGWGLFAWAFSADPLVATWWDSQYGESRTPWTMIHQAVPDQPQVPGLPSFTAADSVPPKAEAEIVRATVQDAGGALATAPAPMTWLPTAASDPFFGVWSQLSRPLWQVFASPQMSMSALAFLVLCGLWSLGVWSFFGGAISRIAAVQLASEERVGWAPALRYATSKWASYFASPLFPTLGIILAAIPLFVLGLLLRANFGVLLVGLVWPLMLLGGLIMALLLLGLVFGWPLMWGTISTEGSDSFDALSRSYAYVFQRPFRYLFYAFVAAVLGWLGWLLVQSFAAGVVWLTYWGASWGAGNDRMTGIASGQLDGMGYAGSALITFWARVVKWLALGFVYGYFWTAATAIYLLLRRDVDATEMDEVFLDADQSEPLAGPAPIKNDAAGAPAAEVASASVTTTPLPSEAAVGIGATPAVAAPTGDGPQPPPATL